MNSWRKLRRREKHEMQLKSFRLRWLVQRILWEEFNRKLFGVSKADLYRLFILDSWRQRYKVSIRFILTQLIPIHEKRFAQHKRKPLFGTKLATLVGKKSEKLLETIVAETWPDGANKAAWRNRKQFEIIEQRLLDDSELELKTLLDFKTVKQYARYYRKQVTEKRIRYDKAATDPENRKRPYRGSPWV